MKYLPKFFQLMMKIYNWEILIQFKSIDIAVILVDVPIVLKMIFIDSNAFVLISNIVLPNILVVALEFKDLNPNIELYYE